MDSLERRAEFRVTPSLPELIRLFSRQRGAELPPDWLGDDHSADLDEDTGDALAELCERLGWKPPQEVHGRPRANQFPLMTFEPGRGWAIAEQWLSIDTFRVAGVAGETSRPFTR